MAQIDDAELERLRAVEACVRRMVERSREMDTLIMHVPRADFENAPTSEADLPGEVWELARLLSMPARQWPPLPADRETFYRWVKTTHAKRV